MPTRARRRAGRRARCGPSGVGATVRGGPVRGAPVRGAPVSGAPVSGGPDAGTGAAQCSNRPGRRPGRRGSRPPGRRSPVMTRPFPRREAGRRRLPRLVARRARGGGPCPEPRPRHDAGLAPTSAAIVASLLRATSPGPTPRPRAAGRPGKAPRKNVPPGAATTRNPATTPFAPKIACASGPAPDRMVYARQPTWHNHRRMSVGPRGATFAGADNLHRPCSRPGGWR